MECLGQGRLMSVSRWPVSPGPWSVSSIPQLCLHPHDSKVEVLQGLCPRAAGASVHMLQTLPITQT